MGKSDRDVTSAFNKIYDSTSKFALNYITAKCGNTDDIGDILQETYMEVYSIMLDKGADFIDNDEAFVINIAKNKIYKYYSKLEKAKADLSLSVITNDNGEININLNPEEVDIDDSICDKALIDEIEKHIKSKSTEIQKIFFMRFSLDLSITEIANLLDKKESHIKNKLYRTINELRELYAGKGEIL